MMEANRTIALKVKLNTPNAAKADKLVRAQAAYAEAVNYFVRQADALRTTSRAKLNAATYHEAIQRFDLNSSTLQAAMLKALAAYRSVVARRTKGQKAALPVFKRPIPFAVRQDRWRIVQTETGTPVLLMSFLPGRSQTAFPLVDCEPLHQRMEDLKTGRCRQGSAEVWQGKDGNWYAVLSLIYPIQTFEPKDWLGVDLGIVHHAVAATADGKHRLFFDGKPARWRRERWHERRRALQACGRLARVKREEGRERRWATHINHVISRRLVDKAKVEGFGIALEQLAGIRKRARAGKKFNRMMASWPFDQLARFIEYKAALAGVPVKWVDPRHTSSTCPRCGAIDGKSRPNQATFRCAHCGYTALADYVGARNIAHRAHAMSGGLASPEEGSVASLMAQGGVDVHLHHTS